MKKHLLVYDVDWWVLGKHAQLVKKYHPLLEIASIQTIYNTIGLYGASKINEQYEIISTMCLGLAQMLLTYGVRVDSSMAVSYFYFSNNQHFFKEWTDEIELNYSFINNYLKKVKNISAINPNLAQTLKVVSPDANIKCIKQFVDTEHFKQNPKKDESESIVIGWVGDTEKKSKNYYNTFSPIKNAFQDHPKIRFSEATIKSFIPLEKMPEYYNKIDLLVITGNNEGGPAPALEANACGVPVLSTNIGYVKEVTPLESRHLILDSNDPKDFIVKINQLSNDKEKLRNLGLLGRKHVEEHFSIEATIGDWVSSLFYLDKKQIK